MPQTYEEFIRPGFDAAVENYINMLELIKSGLEKQLEVGDNERQQLVKNAIQCLMFTSRELSDTIEDTEWLEEQERLALAYEASMR